MRKRTIIVGVSLATGIVAAAIGLKALIGTPPTADGTPVTETSEPGEPALGPDDSDLEELVIEGARAQTIPDIVRESKVGQDPNAQSTPGGQGMSTIELTAERHAP